MVPNRRHFCTDPSQPAYPPPRSRPGAAVGPSTSTHERKLSCPRSGEGLACAPGSASLYAGGWPPCAPCPVNTHAPAAAASACLPCPNRTFAGAAGASACAPCPAKAAFLEDLAACAACGFSCCGAQVTLARIRALALHLCMCMRICVHECLMHTRTYITSTQAHEHTCMHARTHAQ